MTYRELIKKERPEVVGDGYIGGVKGCPHQYFNCEKNTWCKLTSCDKCWNREAPRDIFKTPNALRKSMELETAVQRSETLVIGVDISNDDIACVTIGKLNGIRTDVVKVIRGKAAEELYEILTDTNIDS